jgi:hypothetical protein
MIAQLRKDLGAPAVPVIVGEIGPFVAGNEAVNAALRHLPSEVPLSACVLSAGLRDKGDKLHFDAPSQRELGRRYAEAFLQLKTPAAPASAAGTAPDARVPAQR